MKKLVVALLIGTPLFVVLGHEGCGAVEATIAWKFHGAAQKGRIEVLLEAILPALDDVDGEQPRSALLHQAVEANVRHTVRTIGETAEGRARLAQGGMKLMGGVYDLESGVVRFLD